LIAGLGNTSHPRTRHNVGFAAVDALVASQRSKLVQSWTLSKAEEKNEEVDNQWSVRVIFLKPKGFMNLSGVSVGKAAREYAISPSNILVLHDDLEKPLGRVSLKLSGSANGHNGLRSIISTLHTDAFGRARIGIGRPTNKDDVADYVLQR
ncbi:peptidyl-tRNA hydrolase, partial [Chytriomyces sp. MP71]